MPCDYSKYPPNWKSEIVPRILKRADNRCEVCDLSNNIAVFAIKIYARVLGRYSYRTLWFRDINDAMREGMAFNTKYELKRVVLTIAHLDHDETNHNVKDNRLMAMCQLCHLRYDAKEKMRRIMNNATNNK